MQERRPSVARSREFITRNQGPEVEEKSEFDNWILFQSLIKFPLGQAPTLGRDF